jgi:hypothetical protein
MSSSMPINLVYNLKKKVEVQKLCNEAQDNTFLKIDRKIEQV